MTERAETAAGRGARAAGGPAGGHVDKRIDKHPERGVAGTAPRPTTALPARPVAVAVGVLLGGMALALTMSLLAWRWLGELHQAPPDDRLVAGARRQEVADRQAGSAVSAPPLHATGPRLESAPIDSRRAYVAEKQRQLESAGWVDRARGIAHIPIGQAMALLAARHAPDARLPSQSLPQAQPQPQPQPQPSARP